MPVSIRVKPTPNPNSLTFSPEGERLMERGLLAFHSAAEAADDALGAALFALDGVHSLMIVPEFVTVTKHPAADWTRLSEGVQRILSAHLEA